MGNGRTRAGAIAAVALWLSCHPAWCADAPLTLGSLARSSEHILIGKILSTELISTGIDNQTLDCGVSASIRVLESIIGTAPEIITVGFQRAPLAGKSYFLPLAATSTYLTPEAFKTQFDGAAAEALRSCKDKLPKLSAQQWAVAEIEQYSIGHPDYPSLLEFIQVPPQLWLPGVEPTQAYQAFEPVPDSTTVAGQLLPSLLRTGARVMRWYELRRRFCRVTAETSGPEFCE
jgi:hypothetical protein